MKKSSRWRSIKAWESLQNNPKKKKIPEARGKGGFRRVRWEEAVELIAAANLYY